MKLEFKNISKSFGSNKVLDSISFAATSGRALGYLGRNGAGKTTSIRCLMNVFKPDSGEFLIDGMPFNPKKVSIGYMPEVRGLYDKELILDQLVYFAELRGLNKKQAKANSMEWLEKVGLAEYARKKLSVLSKGNQQKVQIIQCLIHNPDIIILDEPFSGLDPVNSKQLQHIIIEQLNIDKIVIFSSHQMSYIEDFCDDIALLHNSKIVLSGNLDEIKKAKSLGKYVVRARENSKLLSLLEQKELSYYKIKDDYIVDLKDRDTNELLKSIIDSNIELESYSIFKPSLQNIFIEMAGGINE